LANNALFSVIVGSDDVVDAMREIGVLYQYMGKWAQFSFYTKRDEKLGSSLGGMGDAPII
jgi:hypothetical protein